MSETLLETVENIQKHVNLLRELAEITYIVIPEKRKTKEPTTQMIVKNTKTKKQMKEECTKEWYRGQLHRNLRGGILGSFKDVYVPESVIREHGLEENDWVQANIIRIVNKKKKFSFSLLEKHSAKSTENSDRIQLDFCPVFLNEEIKRYYIKKSNTDELDEIILLSEADVQNYQLNNRSVIDFSYMKGNQTKGRVIWSYSVSELQQVKKVKVKKKSTEKGNTEKRPVKPLFQDKIISMIGGGNLGLQKTIKKEVERRCGTLLFSAGDEPHPTIISRLKKSHCVIVYTESISHEAMYLTKNFCKQQKIPISFTKNIGGSLFVARVFKLLKSKR
ncbi:DUF2325 domain-containing protein [Listeria monocytogenes]|uniref:DUF2325 domain-containing protein n=1 Tax=Listeria monocytogenes TaxID=1639 RepID=A0AAN3BCM8_LISMN|nr:DUF2325 domain-containing protein [Listeria monocytogenes]EAC3367805.1 DUF2325 domain-containing protein [Listeria monocytogenes]EAC7086889.1 DUF2325 domain-containing protein [Listeria monocytogenes]EAC8542060.1 DUF2325 domain-containing protein [Listeria monocytogenes]EAC8548062.1 DUF2325 domain-containing protein [Listeria monocytogenes]